MLRRAFRSLLNVEDPPERTALAFAVGTFIAFSPLLGLHVIVASLLLPFWRLNKTALFAGVFLTNPWTIAPSVATAWGIGRWIISSPPVELPQASFSNMMTAGFWQVIASQWPQLLPFAVGAMIMSVCCSLVSYAVMLYSLRAYRRKFAKDISPEATSLRGQSITERN